MNGEFSYQQLQSFGTFLPLTVQHLQSSKNREIEELEMEALRSQEEGEATWAEVFDNANNRMKQRVFTGMLLQSFQQLAGINA